MKNARGILAAVAVLVAAVGCSPAAVTETSPPPKPSASPTPSEPQLFTVYGTVTVPDMEPLADYDDGSPCFAGGGYDDIAAGGQVTVLDNAGVKLAVGELESGEIEGYSCEFEFTVPGVPDGEQLYDVAVGNEHRGGVTFDRADLDFAISIGF